MEHSSSQSFTSMMNSSFPPSDAQSPVSLQYNSSFHPHHSHMNYLPTQYIPSFQHQHPHHANLYAQGGYQQVPSIPPGYHGVASQGNMGQYPPGAFGAGSSSSPASPADAYLFLDLLEALVQEEMRTVQLDLVLPCHLHIKWMKIRLSIIKMAVIVVLMRFRKKEKARTGVSVRMNFS